eukprot:398779-Amphidinium_carterae.2
MGAIGVATLCSCYLASIVHTIKVEMPRWRTLLTPVPKASKQVPHSCQLKQFINPSRMPPAPLRKSHSALKGLRSKLSMDDAAGELLFQRLCS